MKKITRIVIVGGGFGGVYSAINLSKKFKKDEVEITLISKYNYFLFTPLLHEVATGGLSPDSIVEPIREVMRGYNINFVEDTVLDVDLKIKEVRTITSKHNYDYLVYATGSVTNYFATTGAKENCFSLKNLSDAISLRNHLVDTCEMAVKTKNTDLLKLSVVGAGPTGVELAAELLEFMQHTLCTYYKDSGFKKEDIVLNLITTTPEVISQFPVKMRTLAMQELIKKGVNVITNASVTKVEPKLVTFKDATTLNSHTIVWVAGVAPNTSEVMGIASGPKGRIETNEYLQSTTDSSVFGLGDASGSSPMLAQVAVQQAKTVANNIYTLATGGSDLTKYIFKQKGLLISVGQWYAIGNFGNITLSGGLMWWLWRTIYLFNFISWRKRFEIASEWTLNIFYPRDISRI